MGRIRRKLSLDTTNAKNCKNNEIQGECNNPLAHPCYDFWLARRRLIYISVNVCYDESIDVLGFLYKGCISHDFSVSYLTLCYLILSEKKYFWKGKIVRILTIGFQKSLFFFIAF